MDEKDRIKQEDAKLAYQQAKEADKKQIEAFIEFHLHNGPESNGGFKTHRAKKFFNDMTAEFEELLYKRQEDVEKL